MSIPIYVSLTSIYSRQEYLYECLSKLLKQRLLPNKIFIYLSEERSYHDDGFKNKEIDNSKLKNLINNEMFSVIWGKDMGPYGKLLPLLKSKLDEDCIIITLDDDTSYDFDLIKNLVEDYDKHKCVISYRGFTPKMENLNNFDYFKRVDNIDKHLYNFATGKGGILYHPSFFKNTQDLIFRNDIFMETCKFADDVWFYIVRIANKVPCLVKNKKWLLQDYHDTKKSLFFLNNNSQNNTKQYQQSLKKLIELGYL